MREVEEVLAKYPKVKEELKSIELAFEDMAMATAISPKTDLKSSILSAVDTEVRTEKKEVPTQLESEARVVEMKSSGTWKLAVAASLALAIISGYLAFDYRSKWKNTDQRYAQLLATNNQMAEQYNQVNQKLGDLENDLEILGNPEFARIGMAGTENAADSYASVYWNQTFQELYLSINELRQLATDQ